MFGTIRALPILHRYVGYHKDFTSTVVNFIIFYDNMFARIWFSSTSAGEIMYIIKIYDFIRNTYMQEKYTTKNIIQTKQYAIILIHQ